MKSRLFNIAVKKSVLPIIAGVLFSLAGLGALVSGEFSLATIACAVLGIGLLYVFGLPLLNGGYLKEFNAVLTGNGLTMEQVEADLTGAQSLKNMELGRNYALILSETPKLVILRNLVWCYGVNTTTTHKLYGVIPTGKSMSYSVKLINRDRSEVNISVAKEADTAAILQAIQAKVPEVIFGHNENLANVAQNNFASMVQYVDQKRMQG